MKESEWLILFCEIIFFDVLNVFSSFVAFPIRTLTCGPAASTFMRDFSLLRLFLTLIILVASPSSPSVASLVICLITFYASIRLLRQQPFYAGITTCLVCGSIWSTFFASISSSLVRPSVPPFVSYFFFFFFLGIPSYFPVIFNVSITYVSICFCTIFSSVDDFSLSLLPFLLLSFRFQNFSYFQIFYLPFFPFALMLGVSHSLLDFSRWSFLFVSSCIRVWSFLPSS